MPRAICHESDLGFDSQNSMVRKRLEPEPGVFFRNEYHAGNRRRREEEAVFGLEVAWYVS